MSAMFVGRVGGLAVALGVGAVAFQAAGVAWADTSTDSASQSVESSAGPSVGRHAANAGPARAARAAASTAVRAGKNSSPAASRTAANPAAAKAQSALPVLPSVTRTAAPVAAAVAAPATAVVTQPAASPAVVDSAPAVVAAVATASATSTATTAAAPAPEAAPVAAFLTNAEAALSDSAAGDNTDAPVNTPVEWSALAVARRGALGAASVTPPAAAAAVAGAPTYDIGACTQASASCTYIMGPSGVPIPTDPYATTVMKYYVLPNTTQADTTAQLVFTPEGAYPVTGIKVLPLTISAQQGQTILENTIQTLQPGPVPGNLPITIFGYSQSAVISSLLQRDLTSTIGLLPGVDRSQLTYVTVGQEMNPDGGWFARFPGLNVAALGEYFFGSTPENAFPTTNYTLEYDGFADSPRYPLNFLSDLNAAMGILLVHTNYANPNYFANTYGTVLGSYDPVMGNFGPGVACNASSASCTELPTTTSSLPPQFDTQNYYFIQTPNLPLLAPVRAIPFIGKPLAALVQPVLKVIVNLGYGDQAHGFTSATQPLANVALPFGLFPQVSPKEVFQQLNAGVKQGIHDFFAAFGEKGGGGGQLPKLNLDGVLKTMPARISSAASALYATLLSTADFLNAALITLPAYDVTLFAEGIKQAFSGQGQLIEGLVNAIGRPIAADVGMIGTISVLQIAVWLEAAFAAATGCGPAAPTTGLCILG